VIEKHELEILAINRLRLQIISIYTHKIKVWKKEIA